MSICRAKSAQKQAFPPHPQQGSAIIWIFIMIGLFAALGFAFSQGFRSGGSSLSAENVKIRAAELSDFLRAVRGAAQTMKINGCADTEFGFENTVYKNNVGGQLHLDALYPNSPSDHSCDMFYPQGGGITPQKFPSQEFGNPGATAEQYDEEGTLPFDVYIAKIPGIGTSEPDLIGTISYVHMDICNKINETVGIGLYSGTVPTYDLDPANGFAPPSTEGTAGYYNITNPNYTDQDPYGTPLDEYNSDLNGKTMFCAANTNSANAASVWSIVHVVLIAR